jgi:hypothetical protein
MARKLDFIVFGVPRSGRRFAGASKALAGFQRVGAYQRLKSLYAQRWALRRRFASIR